MGVNVKLAIVPGRLVELDVDGGCTILQAAAAAALKEGDVAWVDLVKGREVRLNNRKISNVPQYDPDKYFGAISTTGLNDGDAILVLTQIQGNAGEGLGVLVCTVNGAPYTLPTPQEVGTFLRDVVKIDLSQIKHLYINGNEAHATDLIGNEAKVNFSLIGDENDDEAPLVITVNGEEFTDKLAAISHIIGL